jgi:hypothetical protein
MDRHVTQGEGAGPVAGTAACLRLPCAADIVALFVVLIARPVSVALHNPALLCGGGAAGGKGTCGKQGTRLQVPSWMYQPSRATVNSHNKRSMITAG